MKSSNNGVTAEVVTPPKPEEVVVLTLPLGVATTLHSIVRNISGSNEYTYRRHTDDIRLALHGAGVPIPANRFIGTLDAKTTGDVQ